MDETALLENRIRLQAQGLGVLIARWSPALISKFDNRESWDNKPKFDNRPSWDNWNKR
ncbi:multiple cyclophane-containing RiPP AmcA [Amycolatopsis sp. cg5]|uniref:multiple cyclophane-containing RiPP AmcA n=1 Tax=Amycolatopsis sp. cg5 TaxID=3238802 RepID=UPI003524C047